MPLELTLIQGFHTLEALRAEWRVLFQKATAGTPFQSPAWLIPWWRCFGNERLWTVACRENRELVALFPLYIERKDSGIRELKFIGAGISDCLDGLIVPGMEETVCDGLFGFMNHHSREWDICYLEQLPPNSPILQCGERHGLAVSEGEQCLYAELPPSPEQWSAFISPSLSHDIQYSWRRLNRMGTVEFSAAGPATFCQYLEVFMELHAARWQLRREPGVFAEPIVRDFHREAAVGLLSAGLLRLYRVNLDGSPVSGIYAFSHRERLYVYLTAFDPRFAKYSVGSLAIHAAIERAIHEGCRAVDFLRGNEPYKYRFGATEQHRKTFRCSASELRHSRQKTVVQR